MSSEPEIQTGSSNEPEKTNQSSDDSIQTRPTSPDSADRERSALRPPVDVIEDTSGITLLADMPGVNKDKLDLNLENDQLIIEGEISINMPEQMSASHAELQSNHYRRAFTLSKELDPENIHAEFRHGVLKLRIPKAKHAQPRKIAISVS